MKPEQRIICLRWIKHEPIISFGSEQHEIDLIEGSMKEMEQDKNYWKNVMHKDARYFLLKEIKLKGGSNGKTQTRGG